MRAWAYFGTPVKGACPTGTTGSPTYGRSGRIRMWASSKFGTPLARIVPHGELNRRLPWTGSHAGFC